MHKEATCSDNECIQTAIYSDNGYIQTAIYSVHTDSNLLRYMDTYRQQFTQTNGYIQIAIYSDKWIHTDSNLHKHNGYMQTTIYTDIMDTYRMQSTQT
jgi:hypothetical protein